MTIIEYSIGLNQVIENSITNKTKEVPMYSNVKAELARKNMTVVDLSDKTGIRYQTLIDKINGKYPVTLDEAKKVKAALGVDIPLEDLFEASV